MKLNLKKIMIGALVMLITLSISACGGGGGGGSTGAVTSTVADSADSGSVEGYVYTSLEGDISADAARVAGRTTSRAPLAGVTIVCEGVSTTTNEKGYYILRAIPIGPRTIAFTKPGFNPFQLLITIIAQTTVTATDEDSDIALEPAAEGSIYVSSYPSGAAIFLDGAETGFVTPNTLGNVAIGDHTVLVEATGYDTPSAVTLTVYEGSTASADFTLTETVETPDIPVVTANSYVIVDTNETTCYGAASWMSCPSAGASFFGQDAQYDGAQPSYTDNGDGTITDNVTGLMWQKDPGDKMTFSQAAAGADSFSLAGYDDWRLPTIKELYSLIIFSGQDPSGYSGTDTSGLVPFIDTNYFDFEYGDTSTGERIIDSQFASKNVYVGDGFDEETLFGVNFADGRIKGYGTTIFGSEKTFFVLYVRGGNNYGENDFSDNGNGTVTDYATGLTWQQADSGEGMVWEDALSYCENLTLGGSSDWRLPNVKELQSIVDYDRAPGYTSSAAIDPIFSATSITNEGGELDWPYYWSSTTHANMMGTGNGSYVAFGRGLGYMNGSWVDVHGAGCQRSDPKTGDPADYPTGHGPQGDAIRIYNHVRCVTGGATTNGTAGDSATVSDYGATTGDVGTAPPAGADTQGDTGTLAGPPQEAFDACSGAATGAACSFTAPTGTISGTCGYGMESELICLPR